MTVHECFYPTCKTKAMWNIFLENYDTLLHQACLDHVGHAIALYECSEEQPVRERYTYLVRKKNG